MAPSGLMAALRVRINTRDAGDSRSQIIAKLLRASVNTAERTRLSEEREIGRLTVSAKRLATWGRVYDNEDLARKAKSMERRIDKLAADRTFISRGSGLRLSLASTRASAPTH